MQAKALTSLRTVACKRRHSNSALRPPRSLAAGRPASFTVDIVSLGEPPVSGEEKAEVSERVAAPSPCVSA